MHFITLGIGDAGSIPPFILTGLSAAPEVEPLLAEYDLRVCTRWYATVTAGTLFTADLDAQTTLARSLSARTRLDATVRIAFEDD